MSDPHILREGDAPTPFTAVEIRDGCPAGRIVTSITSEDGQETVSTTTFVEVAQYGAVLEIDGSQHRVKWTDLQMHASFPEADTLIREETITTGLGTFECLLYEVNRADEVHRFWFARDLPGMPIKRETVAAETVVSTTTVVSNVT